MVQHAIREIQRKHVWDITRLERVAEEGLTLQTPSKSSTDRNG